LFGKEKSSSKWKLEYEDTIYKVYDWNKNLAGYFFPSYNLKDYKRNENQVDDDSEEGDDEIIEGLNNSHGNVRGGSLMVPMVKLNLLDSNVGLDVEYAIQAMEASLERTKYWRNWLQYNYAVFNVIGNRIYTSREDRNMLSIVLDINSDFMLGEKELGYLLTPLLDKLHADGLL
jgi:hypothetical protein